MLTGKIKNSQREIKLARKRREKFQPPLSDEEREKRLTLYRQETDCKQRWIFAQDFYFHKDTIGLNRIIAEDKNQMVIAFAKSYLQSLKKESN